METLYVIQDVKTKEYYWRYRIDEGFNANISEAYRFGSEDSALRELQEEHLQGLFEGKYIEIKKYCIVN